MTVRFSNTFLLRKLHQLTGIVPLGVFFLVHMFTNSKAMNGEANFVKAVEEIHGLPYLLFLEVFGIFVPLLFHSVYGLIISAEAKPNVLSYGYGRNWFYLFQRITGVYLFVFLLFHILNFRFGLIPGLNLIPIAGNADKAFSIVASEFQITWVLIVYILGVLATAWHLAYGVFLFAVDWGIVIGQKAQRATLYGSIMLALVLGTVGVNATVSFLRPCGMFPRSMCEEPPLSVKPAKPSAPAAANRQ